MKRLTKQDGGNDLNQGRIGAVCRMQQKQMSKGGSVVCKEVGIKEKHNSTDEEEIHPEQEERER